ncbi:MAG: outer membrane lipoprotein-sorting protein [Bacteroidales bacterium]|nr:outer membrane lipoprotein-sorting protein [Bacteroidales bacterium]
METKKLTVKLLLVFIIFGITTPVFSQNILTAEEIIKKAEDKFRGELTSEGEMEVIIKRPTWERSISLKSWSKGDDFSLSVITAPAKDKGQSFLKRYNELWTWNPTISRMIKLPPSMMSQGWMGSDYSNDDILRESSIADDYKATLLGEEISGNYLCYKIELIPKEGVAIVWGKIITWISKDEFLQLKAEYYDEDDYLVRTLNAYDIQLFDGRKLPSTMEILPADEPGNKTIVKMKNLKFNAPIEESFFSQQNMKKIR